MTYEDCLQIAEDEWLYHAGEADIEEWSWHWFWLFIGEWMR